jgi:hypothetical protein
LAAVARHRFSTASAAEVLRHSSKALAVVVHHRWPSLRNRRYVLQLLFSDP